MHGVWCVSCAFTLLLSALFKLVVGPSVHKSVHIYETGWINLSNAWKLGGWGEELWVNFDLIWFSLKFYKHDRHVLWTAVWISAFIFRVVSSREGLESIPGQSIWKLRRKMWHCDRFLSAYFGFPLPLPHHYWSILIQSSIIDDSYIILLRG